MSLTHGGTSALTPCQTRSAGRRGRGVRQRARPDLERRPTNQQAPSGHRGTSPKPGPPGAPAQPDHVTPPAQYTPPSPGLQPPGPARVSRLIRQPVEIRYQNCMEVSSFKLEEVSYGSILPMRKALPVVIWVPVCPMVTPAAYQRARSLSRFSVPPQLDAACIWWNMGRPPAGCTAGQQSRNLV
jgi:hypothetical protein